MPDNSILIYRNIWNVTKSGDIYQASYNGDGDWGTPKPILYRNKAISNKINSSYFESSASMTSDEKFIYFVSERPSGKGQTDIYFVEKIGKTTQNLNQLEIISILLVMKNVYLYTHQTKYYFSLQMELLKAWVAMIFTIALNKRMESGVIRKIWVLQSTQHSKKKQSMFLKMVKRHI